MSSYFAVVFTDLVRHSQIWGRVPRTAMTTIIAEYRYLAQSIASQYGRRHENFTGDGHMFLFESADVAAHFGLKLVAYWKQRRRSVLAVHEAQDLPIRVGCHFGQCSQLSDADVWLGRAITVAKRVEATAEPDSFFVTQTVLELIDLPFYDFHEVGLHELKGDFLRERPLYRLSSVDHAAMAERPVDLMSAEDWSSRVSASRISNAQTSLKKSNATATLSEPVTTILKPTITWLSPSRPPVMKKPHATTTERRFAYGPSTPKLIITLPYC
jgi:class 3 adenylate cyclase